MLLGTTEKLSGFDWQERQSQGEKMQKSNGRALAQGIIGWIDRLGGKLDLKTIP